MAKDIRRLDKEIIIWDSDIIKELIPPHYSKKIWMPSIPKLNKDFYTIDEWKDELKLLKRKRNKSKIIILVILIILHYFVINSLNNGY